MKGTILDFLKLATEKPDLTEELVELAAKHGFEFSDEVSDEELETVAGGAWSRDDGLDMEQTEIKTDEADAAIAASEARISASRDQMTSLLLKMLASEASSTGTVKGMY